MTSIQHSNPADFDCDPCDDADRTTRAVAFTRRGRPVCAHCADIAETMAEALAR